MKNLILASLVLLFSSLVNAEILDVDGSIHQVVNHHQYGGMYGATEPKLITVEGHEIELLNVDQQVVCLAGSYTIEIVEDMSRTLEYNDKVFAKLVSVHQCLNEDQKLAGWLESEELLSAF